MQHARGLPPDARPWIPRAALAATVALLAALHGCGGENGSGLDAIPPGAVDDLVLVSATADSVLIRWTAPGDDGDLGQAVRYQVRYATLPLTLGAWDSSGVVVAEPPARSAGEVEALVFRDPPAGRGYMALRAVDEASNWSGLSNVLQIEVPPGDVTPPAAITSLGTTGSPAATSVVLTWIAPGDDGDEGRADHYEIRRHDERFTESAWDSTGLVVAEPAANPPGSIESRRITGLEPESVYFFAVRAYDEAGNRSPLSNQLRVETRPLDETAPARVDDLTARLDGLYDIVLSWTAVGDDSVFGGPAAAYDLRRASSVEALEDWDAATPVLTDVPRASGSLETIRLSGLPPRSRYAFALEVLDDAGNRSGRSLPVSITTSDSSCVVLADGSGDYPTLVDALALGGGCEIVLGDGVFAGPDHAPWPDSATRRIRSASGDPSACIVDFGGAVVNFPSALHIDGLGLRNAQRVLLRAEDPDGFVFSASDCFFESMAFGSDQPVERGPVAHFTDCVFRDGAVSPTLDLGELTMVRCRFLGNRARLAIAYRSEWIECTFEENSAPSGALLRSFNDLQGPNLFRLERCVFRRNESPILGPQNGVVEIVGGLFSRNMESCVLLLGPSTARIEESTFVRNDRRAGSCIRSDGLQPRLEIARSIFVGNTGGPILDIGFEYELAVSCTDVYGNAGGDWEGPLAGLGVEDGNFSADPLFCGWTTEDYALRPGSPCSSAEQPVCGQVGAFGVGCEAAR